MFLQFLVSLIEVRRVFPHDIFKCGSNQWQTVRVPYGKTSCYVLLREKNKKEILLYSFLIKVAAGYVTLENQEKHFQLGLAQRPYAFFLSRITFSKVLLMETDTLPIICYRSQVYFKVCKKMECRQKLENTSKLILLALDYSVIIIHFNK